MFIKRISLYNYRIYKGLNVLDFNHNPYKNLFIIAGNNGYGKTSFLTSLVWCLYGKKIAEVEEAYRKDIAAVGGYKNYAINNLNKSALEEGQKTYYVEIAIRNISIPFLPSEEVVIKREYNYDTDRETVKITIDGYENELTKEVGPDIFINDFVLPKEIAKFFFFDSEKIVNIAESKSLDEMKSISKAYSEVLGIKKYEDLRNNIKDLRLRFKRESAGKDDKHKFDLLQKELDEIKEIIIMHNERLEQLKEEKETKSFKTLHIQERLIREGQTLSLKELTNLRKENDRLIEKGHAIKRQMNELLDLIPFAIAVKKLDEIHSQIEKENNITNVNGNFEKDLLKRVNETINDRNFKKYFKKAVKKSELNNFRKVFKEALRNKIAQPKGNDRSETKELHSFSKEEQNEFNSILSAVKGFFREKFNHVSYDYKQNQIDMRKINRKLSDAEKKEDDLLISSYRTEKESLNKEISEIDYQIITLLSKNETLEKEAAVKQRQISELNKVITLDSDNILKDETSEEIISKLDKFLLKFKKEKKGLLEEKILASLKVLMHKKDFISKVSVDISNELVDINLYNKYDKLINKNELSKGEQQLYATAVLKALVEESNIKFPVFIDSPLQKFDIKHSKNVIRNFYPTISEQVVICPLLEKELTEKEYENMSDNVENAYVISNKSDIESNFICMEPKMLFKTHKELAADVL